MSNTDISEMLSENGFGNIVKSDNDNVFVDTISDCFTVIDAIIEKGQNENHFLFNKPVRFLVTDSSGIQGVAKALDDYDVVFITEGFINEIRRTICMLLAQTCTFKTVGSPVKENDNQQYDGENTLLPECPERREFANGAIQRALEYVFIHELAHIFYGHGAYVNKLYKSTSQYPFLMVQPKNVDFSMRERFRAEIRVDRPAMEIQADLYAADVTLMLGLKEILEQQIDSWSCSDKLLKRLEKQAIQEWVVGLVVIFNIIENISNESHTHPHPKFRRLAATMSAQVVWTSTYRVKRENILIDPNEFLDLVNSTLDEVDVAWRNIGLPTINYSSKLKESDFYNLFDRAVRLFPKLESRFDKQHVI